MQGMVLKPSIALFAIGAAALALGCDTSPTARVSMPDSPLSLLSASTSLEVGAEAKKTDGLTDVAVRTAHATLHPMNQSGVKARIDFVDDGTTLFVTAVATGLDPAQTYLTLIYDNGALPGGPNGCRPTIFDPGDPEFLLNRMVVGSWNVDADGNGALSAINTNFGVDYVPIGLFRAASLRRVLGPPLTPGAPPPTALEACGRVAIEDEEEE